MRVLITGGAGFIGSHLVRRLLADGHEVRVFDALTSGSDANLEGLDVELVQADIRDADRLAVAVRGCDHVLHHAAIASVQRSIDDPVTSNAVNTEGTLNVLLASRAAGVGRVVFASSSAVYGSEPELPKRETQRPWPISPYGVGKLAAEGYCRNFSDSYGLDCVALRYFNVFGPRQDPASEYAAVIPRFAAAILAGRRPTIYGDGEQSRDFAYIDDVVAANVRALSAPSAPGGVFNIASGRRHSLNELLVLLGEVLGCEVAADHLPPREGDIRHSLADVGHAERVLGHTPRVGMLDGLRATVDALGRAAAR